MASACEHTDKTVYALKMCKKCYHAKGRSKLSTACKHTAKPMYARGICKACYLKRYRFLRDQRLLYQAELEKQAQDGNG